MLITGWQAVSVFGSRATREDRNRAAVNLRLSWGSEMHAYGASWNVVGLELGI